MEIMERMNKGKTYWASEENLEDVKKKAGIGDEINVVSLISNEDVDVDFFYPIYTEINNIKNTLEGLDGEIGEVVDLSDKINEEKKERQQEDAAIKEDLEELSKKVEQGVGTRVYTTSKNSGSYITKWNAPIFNNSNAKCSFVQSHLDYKDDPTNNPLPNEPIANGRYAIAFGGGCGNMGLIGRDATTASGLAAIATGMGTKALGTASFSLGRDTEAIGADSIAMGYNTHALGRASFAGGANAITSANAEYSFIYGLHEGADSYLHKVSGRASSAIGFNVEVKSNYGHGIGSWLKVKGPYCTVVGYGNNFPTEGDNNEYRFIVGDGTLHSQVLCPSNAFAVWSKKVKDFDSPQPEPDEHGIMVGKVRISEEEMGVIKNTPSNLNTEKTALQSAINTEKNTRQTADTKIEKDYKKADTDIKTAYKAADATLQTKINEALQAAKDYADEHDANTTYGVADSDTLGLIKVGYISSNETRHYGVRVTGEQAYVVVPWANTEYDAGEGLELNNNIFSIADDGVTNGKIADNAVDTAQLANNAVTTDKIEGLAVTDSKLADGAVISRTIDEKAIKFKHLDTDIYSIGAGDGGGKLVLRSALGKLYSNYDYDNESEDTVVVNHSGLMDLKEELEEKATYTAGTGLQLINKEFSIANDGVDTTQLADGAVTTVKIENSAITNAKIAKYDKDIPNSGIQLSKLNNSVQYGSGGPNQEYHLCLMQLKEESGVKKLKIYSFDTLRDSGFFINEE